MAWKTIAVVGYKGSVSRQEDRRAHGGVCLLQARTVKGSRQGRRVNSTGRYRETGEPFELDEQTLKQWQAIARSSR